MAIDFKGKKFALTNDFGSLVVAALSDDVDQSMYFWNDREGDDYPKDRYTLHTNPDYKESKEMKSDRLADEIMAKGKRSVYTQEMKDGGLIPFTGMEFIYGDDICYCVGFKRDGAMAFETEHGSMNAFCNKSGNSQAMPIDQRTDSEKAIDDIDLSITDTNNSLTDTYKLERNFGTESIALLHKIKAGEVYGVSFTGDKIDQRTDSEKAIDDLVLQINRVQYDANMSDMALKDIIAVAFEAGISFTGDKK